MSLWVRMKIGFMLLVFVMIWGIIAGLLTGLVTFPISLLITTGVIAVNPTGVFATQPMLISVILWLLFLPLTCLFFGLVVPLLPESWFMKNWRKAREKSVF